jgi:hypothetical protein
MLVEPYSKGSNMNPPASSRWTWTTILSGLGSATSLVVSVVALFVSFQAKDVSQRTEDRASGKIKAKFEIVGVFPSDEKSLPAGIKKSDFGSFSVDDPQSLIEWSPVIRIKNTGEYPIDSFRVEVQSWIQSRIPDDNIPKLRPIFGTSVSVLESPPFGKLIPGQSALFSINKGLVEQMLKATPGKQWKDDKHYASFQLRTYCRIVGADSYDGPNRSEFPVLGLVWIPSQFTEDKIKLILEDQSHVLIE